MSMTPPLLVAAALILTATTALAQRPTIALLEVGSATTVTPTKVLSDGTDVLARLGDRPEDYGLLVKTHDTGFNTHTDTPAFGNFESFLGPQGDCMGIAFTCRQLFLRVRWHAGRPPERSLAELVRALTSSLIRPTLTSTRGERWVDIDGWSNLREASRDDGMQKALHQVMTLGQLRNLNPQAIHYLIPVRGWSGQHQKLVHFIDQGKPALLTMTRVPELQGHVILAYKVLEFQKKSLIFTYDCNLGPKRAASTRQYVPGKEDATFKSLLVYDKVTNRCEFHGAYRAASHYDYDNVFVLQNADLDLVIERVKDFLTETVPEAIGGLVKKLPFAG